MSHATRNAMLRRGVVNWWNEKRLKGAQEVIGVYNDGLHLYIHRGSPGIFIAPPTILKMFRFNQVVVRLEHFYLIHGSHTQLTPQGVSTGPAFLFAHSRHGTILRTLIHPQQMVYITMYNNLFEWKFHNHRLTPEVLESALLSW